jgi:hypothetical protein
MSGISQATLYRYIRKQSNTLENNSEKVAKLILVLELKIIASLCVGKKELEKTLSNT